MPRAAAASTTARRVLGRDVDREAGAHVERPVRLALVDAGVLDEERQRLRHRRQLVDDVRPVAPARA